MERHRTHRVEGDSAGPGHFLTCRVGRPHLPDDGCPDEQRCGRLAIDPGTQVSGHRFDRKTGKAALGKVAKVATPHQPHHQQYGSFASNSPITDGTHVIAFFGSRGLYAYTLDGELVWEKDLGQLTMFNSFGEGAWTALDGDKLFVVLDHEGASFLLALDKSTGKELWRTPRQGNTNWSGPYITTHDGRKQVIVSASREVCGYDLEPAH